MSLDGVWVFEISNIYGWERISTVFLEKGRYLGGGTILFSQGNYVIKDKQITFKLDVTQHAQKQTVFGEKRKIKFLLWQYFNQTKINSILSHSRKCPLKPMPAHKLF